MTNPLCRIADELSRRLRRFRFGPPVTHVYHPLVYARDAHHEYLRRFGRSPREVVFVGMNPGPWGMAQTGVPFGEVNAVRDWLAIRAEIRKPAREHPQRPILGWACPRSEVSGLRLWGWARERFKTPQHFFQRFLIVNYCPLLFLEASGRNRTPNKLPSEEKTPLLALCDEALRQTTRYLTPRFVVGVGAFAESRAKIALSGMPVIIGRILHPSPASPRANRNWADAITKQLRELGIHVP